MQVENIQPQGWVDKCNPFAQQNARFANKDCKRSEGVVHRVIEGATTLIKQLSLFNIVGAGCTVSTWVLPDHRPPYQRAFETARTHLREALKSNPREVQLFMPRVYFDSVDQQYGIASSIPGDLLQKTNQFLVAYAALKEEDKFNALSQFIHNHQMALSAIHIDFQQSFETDELVYTPRLFLVHLKTVVQQPDDFASVIDGLCKRLDAMLQHYDQCCAIALQAQLTVLAEDAEQAAPTRTTWQRIKDGALQGAHFLHKSLPAIHLMMMANTIIERTAHRRDQIEQDPQWDSLEHVVKVASGYLPALVASATHMASVFRLSPMLLPRQESPAHCAVCQLLQTAVVLNVSVRPNSSDQADAMLVEEGAAHASGGILHDAMLSLSDKEDTGTTLYGWFICGLTLCRGLIHATKMGIVDVSGQNDFDSNVLTTINTFVSASEERGTTDHVRLLIQNDQARSVVMNYLARGDETLTEEELQVLLGVYSKQAYCANISVMAEQLNILLSILTHAITSGALMMSLGFEAGGSNHQQGVNSPLATPAGALTVANVVSWVYRPVMQSLGGILLHFQQGLSVGKDDWLVLGNMAGRSLMQASGQTLQQVGGQLMRPLADYISTVGTASHDGNTVDVLEARGLDRTLTAITDLQKLYATPRGRALLNSAFSIHEMLDRSESSGSLRSSKSFESYGASMMSERRALDVNGGYLEQLEQRQAALLNILAPFYVKEEQLCAAGSTNVPVENETEF